VATMVRLNHKQAEEVIKKLPERFEELLHEIPAKEGHAYRVTSFTDPEQSYRCAVARREDGWWGKCECPGWTRTKRTSDGKVPCKHVAAALALQGDYDPDEVFGEQAAAAQPEKDVLKNVTAEEAFNSIIEENPFSDKPLDIEVPDAVPAARARAIVERAQKTPALVKPVASIEEVRQVFKAFQQAKLSLLDKDDVQKVYDGTFIKKSGWRKIAVFFGISLQKLDEREIVKDGERIYAVTYRAIAPSGQFQDATGYCSWNEAGPAKRAAKSKEQKAKLEHDVRATAETRAKNRAISDLVGGGEVSAEEMKFIGRWKEE